MALGAWEEEGLLIGEALKALVAGPPGHQGGHRQRREAAGAPAAAKGLVAGARGAPQPRPRGGHRGHKGP